jgi:hypothetical protein
MRPEYAPSFKRSVSKHSLTGPHFDYFWADVEVAICDWPWHYSEEVPDSEGIRMRGTEYVAPDLPALYVYYRADPREDVVTFLGISPAWSKSDLPPED